MKHLFRCCSAEAGQPAKTSKSQSRGKRKGRGKRGGERDRKDRSHSFLFYFFMCACSHVYACGSVDLHAYLNAYMQGPEVNLRYHSSSFWVFFGGGVLVLLR